MKKYKIVKFTRNGEVFYKIEERILIFFWVELGIWNPATLRIETKEFNTKEEAKNALLDWLQHKQKQLIYFYG